MDHTFRSRSDDSQAVRNFYHWLTPALIIALSGVLGWIGSSMIELQSNQAVTLTHIEVQIATLQTQLASNANYNQWEAEQVSNLQTIQANHEHRLTVLEQWRANIKYSGRSNQ